MAIYGNHIGGAITPNTYEILGDDGTTIILAATPTGSEVLLTATENDVRSGKTFASDNGVCTGSKDIPNYRTTSGVKIITSGANVYLNLPYYDIYDYTKMQCIITQYNTSVSNSVSAVKVIIDDCVYDVNSTTQISVVTKDSINKNINFNFINNSGKIQIVRYFLYREEE